MKRLERLTALLSYLQSRRFTKIEELEEKFNISERTIFRDLKALEESGVPLSFEKSKGYYILDKYFLPPLAFSIDEAKSFIFVEQLAKKYTDKKIYQSFASALEKIKNKLKESQLEGIESLESKVGAYIDNNYTPKHLHTAEQACSNQQILLIHYQDIKGKETERMIEPIGITFYSQSWHLIAYCQMREDYRDFSLQRIKKIHVTSNTFKGNRLTLNEYIKKLENSQ